MAPGVCRIHFTFTVAGLVYWLDVKLAPAQLTAHLSPRSSPQSYFQPWQHFAWGLPATGRAALCSCFNCMGPQSVPSYPRIQSLLDGDFFSHISAGSPTLGIICQVGECMFSFFLQTTDKNIKHEKSHGGCWVSLLVIRLQAEYVQLSFSLMIQTAFSAIH